MALNFPTNPTVDQVFGSFVWDGSAWKNFQTLPGGVPAGTIVQWAGATAPSNWLFCDGSAVSRTTYASLFAAIGTAYGTGDGSATFNVPDLRGRVPVGKNGGSFGTLGATGGAETVSLTQNEMPNHGHTFSGTTSGESGHSHTVYGLSPLGATGSGYLSLQNDGNLVWYRGNGTVWSTGGGAGGSRPSISVGGDMTNSTSGSTGHTHTYSGTTSLTGSGTGHNNLQPYQVVNYIIKATAAANLGDSELAVRVGAAEASITTINSTARTVAQGGTGQTSLTAGAYLKGNGTTAIALQAGVPIADVSGSLPIAQGGTGVATGSGLVAIIPTSVTVGSGSASVGATGLITFSGATSVSANGCFTSSYLNYMILFNETGATAYADGNLRLRSSGSDAATAYYRNGILNDATSVMGFNSSNDSNWGNALTTHPATVGHAHSRIEIRDPQLAKPTTYQNTSHAWSGTGSRFLTAAGFHTTPSSYDGFTIYLSSGNFGGTFKIYGFN